VPDPSSPSLKQAWPFRLGTSSYILPADILPNVEYLAPLVDDVELVLFESPDFTNLPSPATVERLRSLAAEFSLTYTIHFPLDLDFGSLDEPSRRRSLDMCARVQDTVASLAPFAYVLHLPDPPDASDLAPWLGRLQESLDCLLSASLPPERLCVENLDYPFSYLAPLLAAYPLSVCLDIGHLLMGGYDLREHLATYMSRCRLIHLHGLLDGTDHKDLRGLHPADLRAILQAASTHHPEDRVVTLEVFSQSDFLQSLEVLRPYLGEFAPG